MAKAVVTNFDRVAHGARAVDAQPGARLDAGVVAAGEVERGRGVAGQKLEEGAEAAGIEAHARRELPEDGAEPGAEPERPEAKKLASGVSMSFRRRKCASSGSP